MVVVGGRRGTGSRPQVTPVARQVARPDAWLQAAEGRPVEAELQLVLKADVVLRPSRQHSGRGQRVGGGRGREGGVGREGGQVGPVAGVEGHGQLGAGRAQHALGRSHVLCGRVRAGLPLWAVVRKACDTAQTTNTDSQLRR